MVLKQGMILAGMGVTIGLVAAVGLTRVMSSLLYGVEERLLHSETPPEEVLEQIQELEAKVQRLTERADFADRLVGDGRSEPSDSEKAV